MAFDLAMIHPVEKRQHPELLGVWEASVRATHDFLPEEHIGKLKPLILKLCQRLVPSYIFALESLDTSDGSKGFKHVEG